MNSSRSFLLLAGLALLGAVAGFGEMRANAQAPALDATDEAAQDTSQSLEQMSVATPQVATDKLVDETAQQRPAGVLASPQVERRGGAEKPSQRVGARSKAEPPALAPNPLWALPLARFSITRERPIFSPSRRPPPPPPTYVAPVAVRPPPKPPEPEHPAVSLVGTVVGTDVQIGIFLEQATQNVIRLRLGEEHQGWVLRLVKAGEVTLVKGVAETLALGPPPGAPAVRGPVATPVVPNSIGTTPVVNTADYVDEQPLPRAAQRQRH